MPLRLDVPAAIVLFKPEADILRRLLVALDTNGRRIFLYLNGGVEPEVKTQISRLANANVIYNPENVGLGTGLNILAATAVAEGFSHLQFFDQDSTPTPELPAELMARFVKADAEGMRLAIIGPLLTTPAGENFCENRYSWRNREVGTADFAPTSGSIISLAAWRQVGPFRDDYFIGGIDVEWCFRAWHHGFATLISTSTPMVHRWGTDVARSRRWLPQIARQSETRNYFYIRNAVDTLRLGFIPIGWRLRFGARLLAQICFLVLSRPRTASQRRTVRRAIHDGWSGKLGPLPTNVAAGQ